MKSSSLRHFFTIYTAIFQLHDRDLLKTREYVILQALEDKGRGPNFSQFHGFWCFFWKILQNHILAPRHPSHPLEGWRGPPLRLILDQPLANKYYTSL